MHVEDMISGSKLYLIQLWNQCLIHQEGTKTQSYWRTFGNL